MSSLRQNIDHSLDKIRGLGYPERAAISDTARRLIGIDALDRYVGDRDVVGPGADAEKSGRVFGRVRARVKGAVIGQYTNAQGGDAALLGRRDLAAHMVVAGEGRRLQILHAVFYPLDRYAEHDRGDDRADVARVDPDLVTKPAADIGRDNADLVLGDAGDQRGYGAHGVRRPKRAPNRQAAA